MTEGNVCDRLRRRPASGRSALGLAAVLAVFLATVGPAVGAEEETPPAEPSNGAQALVDLSHEKVSETLEALARRLDSYFVEEQAYEEPTGSFAQLSGIATYREGGDVSLRPRVRANLVLPHTQKRLRFYLESRDETPTEEEAAHSDTAKVAEQSNEDRSVFAGLFLSLLRSGKWNANLGGGVRVRIPPDAFLRARARYSLPLGSWLLRAAETAFWYASVGVGETSRLDFDRSFSDDVLFRSSSEATYLLEDDNFDLSQGFSLYHQMTERQAVVWHVGAFGETNPRWRRVAYVADVRYRVRCYRKWIYGEVKPEVRWEREDRFRPTSSITFRLDFLFGDEYE